MKSCFSPVIRKPSVMLIGCLVWLAGCASAPPDRSLYERLGGMPMIKAIVDKKVDGAASDPRSKRSFEGVNLARTKEGIVIFICAATGGPCKYQGASMSKVHEGMGITSVEFDVVGGHLSDTLDELHVGAREKKELLDLLGSMKRDIVTK